MRINTLAFAALAMGVLLGQETKPVAKSAAVGSCTEVYSTFLETHKKTYSELTKGIGEAGIEAIVKNNPTHPAFSFASLLSKSTGAGAITTDKLASSTLISWYRGVDRAKGLLLEAKEGDGMILRDFMDKLGGPYTEQIRAEVATELTQACFEGIFTSGTEPMSFNDILVWMKKKRAAEKAAK